MSVSQDFNMLNNKSPDIRKFNKQKLFEEQCDYFETLGKHY